MQVLAHVYAGILQLYRVCGMLPSTCSPRTRIQVRRCIKSVPYLNDYLMLLMAI